MEKWCTVDEWCTVDGVSWLWNDLFLIGVKKETRKFVLDALSNCPYGVCVLCAINLCHWGIDWLDDWF